MSYSLEWRTQQNHREHWNLKFWYFDKNGHSGISKLTSSEAGNLCSGFRFNMGTGLVASCVSGSSVAMCCSCFTMIEHSLCWRDHIPLSKSEKKKNHIKIKWHWTLWDLCDMDAPPPYPTNAFKYTETGLQLGIWMSPLHPETSNNVYSLRRICIFCQVPNNEVVYSSTQHIANFHFLTCTS